MNINHYHFTTHWHVEAEAGEVYDLLSAPQNYSEWIKSFSIRVESVAAGDASGVGRVDSFQVKGLLPYTLAWELKCVEAERPHFFTALAAGDLEGRGSWIFSQRRIGTDICFDWEITVRKPLLRNTSFLLRPVFEWNHNWIMQRWEKDLQLALRRSPKARRP